MDPRITLGGSISGSWLRLVPTCIPSPFLPLPEFVSHLLLEMAYYGEFCGTEIKHDTLQFIAFPVIFFRSDVGAIHLCHLPSCYAIGLSDGVWLMHGVRTFLISTSGDLII